MSTELLISVFFPGRFRIVASFPSRYSKRIALVSARPGMGSIPSRPHFPPPYHSFFLPFFSPLSYTSFFPSFFILFCPPLISSSPFPLPSFFFFLSPFIFLLLYFLLILFLPLFFLSPILFPLLFFLYFFSSPFCFFSCFHSPLFCSPGSFILFPSSLFLPSRPSIIFFFSYLFHLFAKGAAIKQRK